MRSTWIGIAGCILACMLTGKTEAAGKADSIPSVTIPWLEGKGSDVVGWQDWEGAGSVDIKPRWSTSARTAATARFFFDDSLLYFAFDVEDTTVHLFTSGDELSVVKGDRVELFFTSSLGLHDYYCWEISPAGVVLDYRAKYKRQFDNSWHCPGVRVATHLWGKGYTVRGGIPMRIVRQLWQRVSGPSPGPGPASGRKDCYELYVGVFSADFCDEEEAHATWSSWVAPRSDQPDFHIPSAFGRFIFCPR